MKILIKAFLRHCIVYPFILLNYRLTICGLDETLGKTDSAIVVVNHTSFMDAPLLVSIVWPIQLRGVVWYEEYARPYFRPFFKLFDAFSVGSSNKLPKRVRLRCKEKSMQLMIEALASGQHVALSPEGGINDGTGVKIAPHFSGLHDLIRAHPTKPLVLVTMEGLQCSVFGRAKNKCFHWKRLPVTVTFQTIENVSLEGGPAGLNRRVEQFYNDGIPLTTVGKQSV